MQLLDKINKSITHRRVQVTQEQQQHTEKTRIQVTFILITMTRVRKSSKKLDTYQICVTVIEAKHLEQNGSPMVVVRVGNRKKKTAVRKSTDNPYYNEVRGKLFRG